MKSNAKVICQRTIGVNCSTAKFRNRKQASVALAGPLLVLTCACVLLRVLQCACMCSSNMQLMQDWSCSTAPVLDILDN